MMRPRARARRLVRSRRDPRLHDRLRAGAPGRSRRPRRALARATSRAPWSSPAGDACGAAASRSPRRCACRSSAAPSSRRCSREALRIDPERARTAASPTLWRSAVRAGCSRASTVSSRTDEDPHEIHRFALLLRSCACAFGVQGRGSRSRSGSARSRRAALRGIASLLEIGEKWRAAQGAGAAVHRLRRRLAGRRSRHGAPHARRPAERGDAFGHRPDRDRSPRCPRCRRCRSSSAPGTSSTTCARSCAPSSRSASSTRASWCSAGATPAGCAFSRKEPALRPADYRRMKIFAWAGDAPQADIMKSLGYQPVVLEVSDILPGLQTGMVNMVPSTPFWALTLQFYNQALAHARARLGADGRARCSSRARSGTPCRRPAATRCARQARTPGAQLRAVSRREHQESVAAMQKRGLKVQPLSPEVAGGVAPRGRGHVSADSRPDGAGGATSTRCSACCASTAPARQGAAMSAVLAAENLVLAARARPDGAAAARRDRAARGASGRHLGRGSRSRSTSALIAGMLGAAVAAREGRLLVALDARVAACTGARAAASRFFTSRGGGDRRRAALPLPSFELVLRRARRRQRHRLRDAGVARAGGAAARVCADRPAARVGGERALAGAPRDAALVARRGARRGEPRRPLGDAHDDRGARRCCSSRPCSARRCSPRSAAPR